jgi:hypothetical protein
VVGALAAACPFVFWSLVLLSVVVAGCLWWCVLVG